MGTKKIIGSRWFIGIVCLVLGAAVVLAIRFATYKKPDEVHYHANFAVYLNGQQELFKSPQYYTETATCSENATITPMGRAHMHDNINNVAHVEDHAVTWGQFFNNLGWTVGPNLLETADGTLYTESASARLHVIVDGQDYTGLGSIANREIKDQDKLLLSFGDESQATVMQQYRAIPSTARHYDVTPDPETCSGSRGPTMHDRMTHML